MYWTLASHKVTLQDLQTSCGQYIECTRSSTCFLGQGWSYCGWCSTFWGGCICGHPVRTARGGWGYRSEDCRDEGTQEAASPSQSQTPVTLFSHMASLPACTWLEWKKKGVSEKSQPYLWTVPTMFLDEKKSSISRPTYSKITKHTALWVNFPSHVRAGPQPVRNESRKPLRKPLHSHSCPEWGNQFTAHLHSILLHC